MACVTLKRPLEWVDPSMSAEASGPSSPKAMMIDAASAARSPKRLRMPSSGNQFSSSSSTSASSSFFKPITTSDIREQIAGELRKLKIARRTMNNNNNNNSAQKTQNGSAGSSTAQTLNDENNCGNKSPAHSDSAMGGCSPDRSDFISDNNTDLMTPSTSSSLQNSFTLYNQLLCKRRRTVDATDEDNENKPLFSFNQVVKIVERLLKDKEGEIRQEYDTILVNRLAEQYEQFVKFTYDQIQRNFDSQSTPSYLS